MHHAGILKYNLTSLLFSVRLPRAKRKLIGFLLLLIGMVVVCVPAIADEYSISWDPAIEQTAITPREVPSHVLPGNATYHEPDCCPSKTSLMFIPPYNAAPVLERTRFYERVPDPNPWMLITQSSSATFRITAKEPQISRSPEDRKSYFIPGLEIPAFVIALNGFDRLVFGYQKENGKRVYSTNWSTFWDHLVHGPWRYDNDAFNVNQLEHPYHGSIYHGFARSAGLNFWESLGYTFLGSFLWETAGEATNPSINDQVASGIAGSFLGEALFRMGNLLLESGGPEPGLWREFTAAALSPSTGFNRFLFGNRFKGAFPSHDPAIFHSLTAGENLVVSKNTGSSITNRNMETFKYSMFYGLPGKQEYNYKRPFDYFELEVNFFSRENQVNILTEGLLLGKRYELGNSYRGVWGLYGSFDYLSPRSFRVSSTAASLGTTAQSWVAPALALQGTALGGAGLGAGGETPSIGDRDYRFGIIGRTLLEIRLIFGQLAMLQVRGRGYYVSNLGGSNPQGTEMIGYLETGLTFRIYGHHCVGIEYVGESRDSQHSHPGNKHQTMGILGLNYTLISDLGFGAVEWRKN